MNNCAARPVGRPGTACGSWRAPTPATGTYPGEENSLAMQVVGAERVVETTREAGVATGLSAAVHHLFAKAEAEGHAAESVASVFETLRTPAYSRPMAAETDGEWVLVVAARNDRGDSGRRGWERWLRGWGIDWDPFHPHEVRIDIARVALPDGGVGCVVSRSVRTTALRRLGIAPGPPPDASA
ncbi:hypothetical protein [Streptomyces radicis]|uniref:imine reductase family protein n=1 Tax=Streptomyces radicis TaxID=1750517 RepID=UPI0038B5B166